MTSFAHQLAPRQKSPTTTVNKSDRVTVSRAGNWM